MSAVAARRFDMHSSRPRPIHIEAGEGDLWLRSETGAEPVALDDVSLSDPHGGTPRLLHLPDGGICEVDDLAGLDGVLDEIKQERKHKTIWRQGLRRHGQIAVLAILVLGCLATIGYRLGLAVFSSGLANRIPSHWVHAASEKTLATLDRDWLQPSHLDSERQAELRNRFVALRAPIEGAPPYRLLFRQGGRVGARTFSLPDGDIVITDEMVALASDNRQILALLAYELGHLHYKHALMHAVRNTAVATTLAGYLSDTTAGTTALSNSLLQVKYSFDSEHQADAYAASMLRANGLPPGALVDILVLQAQNMRSPGNTAPHLLSAEGSLPERIEALRNGI